jgi:hypothetical protein
MASFNDKWKFISEVSTRIGAIDHMIVSDGKFKTGRNRAIIRFNLSSSRYAEHQGMEMMSKKTNKPYWVCNVDAMLLDYRATA